jgi:hypothetical protein
MPETMHYTTMDEECREHHDDTHAKKLLREQSFKELCESGERYQRLWMRRTAYKLKKDEIAKILKVMRMIGDLGCPASLQGFRLFDFMKKAMAHLPLEHSGGISEFIAKPTYQSLRHVFDSLMCPVGRFYFCYFSDDSCFSFLHRGEQYIYNVDISKCDASHGSGIFAALQASTPLHMQYDMANVIEQCGTPVEIKSVSDPKRKVILQFDTLRLYSGWTGTTVINNLANLTISVCLARALDRIDAGDLEPHLFEGVFTEEIEKAGYIVTGLDLKSRCQKPEDIQFLKCSPTMDVNGTYQPVLNLGVFLRASGTCKGDMPGRKTTTIEERSRQFQHSIVHGMYPNIDTPLLENFRVAAGEFTSDRARDMVKKDMMYKADMSDSPPLTFHTQDFLRRYSLTGVETTDLLDFSRSVCGTGITTANSFVTRILKPDYGLKALPTF